MDVKKAWVFQECGRNAEQRVQIRIKRGLSFRTCNFRTERKINYGTISELGVVSTDWKREIKSPERL